MGIAHPAHSAFNKLSVAGKKARWLMVDDYELQRTEQGSGPIHMAMLSIATILDALALVLGVYPTVLDLANVLFSIPLVTES